MSPSTHFPTNIYLFKVNNTNTRKRYEMFKINDIEAIVQMYSVKKVFSEISQNPRKNTYARVSFLIKLQV